MDLREKIRELPTSPGCYLYKDADGDILYVGKAIDLRARVRNYFSEEAQADAKTGSLMREAVDIEVIVVANEGEALALENNLIKRHKPRFNILLRDDKTYPFIKLTTERFPRVYVTRRIRKDGGRYFGPYFPANLAHRTVDLIHKLFKIPSCKVDLTRYHQRPCLEFHIKRCLGPCVKDLTTPDIYADAIRDLELFLDGKTTDLAKSLRTRMEQAASAEQFEAAARFRDQLSTVAQLQERQRIDASEGDDADVFGYHFEQGRVAVFLFHMRNGKILDRRSFFWEDLPESGVKFDPGIFLSALLKQLYLDQQYVPRNVFVPVDFEDRELLETTLTEKRKSRDERAVKVEIHIPQRGDKRSLLDLAAQNAKQNYEQRFRVEKPSQKVLQEALQDTLTLPALPKRIECFDISHFQGAETVASMVVWLDGKMAKSEYRKFIIKTVKGVDDFASMREVVGRRYKRLRDEEQPMPSLILIDGGIGQLHAAANALEDLAITGVPLASIAKREETLYVLGQEDEPIILDRHSPVLHLIQLVRDEAHRFAVTFHRVRRKSRDLKSDLLDIPGIGPSTVKRLLEHFGSLDAVKKADATALRSVLNSKQCEALSQWNTGLHT